MSKIKHYRKCFPLDKNELKERSKAKGAPKNQNHLKKRLKKVITIVGKKNHGSIMLLMVFKKDIKQ